MKIKKLTWLFAAIALLIVLIGCGVYEYSGDMGEVVTAGDSEDVEGGGPALAPYEESTYTRPELGRAITLLPDFFGEHIESWLGHSSWDRYPPDYDNIFPVGLYYHFHRLEVWRLFRDDMPALLEALTIISSESVTEHIVSIISRNLANAMLLDPVLHNEIIASASYSKGLLSCEDSAFILCRILSKAEDEYNFILMWWQEYKSTTEAPEPVWTESFDWANGILPTQALMAIDSTEVNFRNQGLELGVLDIMRWMRFGVSGADITCFVTLMAYVNCDVRDIAIQAMIDRIVLLRDEGLEVYRIYLDMITDSSRIFDPLTEAIFAAIKQRYYPNFAVR